MPKLYHPDARSCSFEGKAYARAADGSFDVPAEAAATLVGSHGFTMEPPPAAAEPAPEPPQKKGKKS